MHINSNTSLLSLQRKNLEAQKNLKNTSLSHSGQSCNLINFTSLDRVRLEPTKGSQMLSFNKACVNYTSYFRSPDAINCVKKILVEDFPEGALILDYACSNGEETESIAMQLSDVNEDAKYRIIGYDIDPDVIEIAKNQKHCICETFEDGFLLKDDSEITPEQAEYKALFYKHFEKTDPPASKLFNIANGRSEEDGVYFKVKKDTFDNVIDYRGGNDSGNIENIDTVIIQDKRPPAVVLFRNAFYHLTDNPSYKALSSDFELNSYDLTRVKPLINKVYDKLPQKGLFVLGNSHYNHVYLVPENVPDDECLNLAETEEGKRQIQILQDRCKAFSQVLTDKLLADSVKKLTEQKKERIENAKIYRVSPVQKALEEDGHFKPVFWEPVDNFPEMLVPTVWQKIN